MTLARIVTAVALSLLGACALTSKGTPVEVSWYTPEPVTPSVTRASNVTGPPLLLGRVSSGFDMGKRIAYGDGAYQVGYYEDRRWTERPEEYVRSALDRTLLEAGRFSRVVDGEAPTLDVEVIAFQEILNPQLHGARIALHIVLSTDRVLHEETVVVTRPAAGERFDDVVAAMAKALDEASNDVAGRVRAVLSKQSPPMPSTR